MISRPTIQHLHLLHNILIFQCHYEYMGRKRTVEVIVHRLFSTFLQLVISRSDISLCICLFSQFCIVFPCHQKIFPFVCFHFKSSCCVYLIRFFLILSYRSIFIVISAPLQLTFVVTFYHLHLLHMTRLNEVREAKDSIFTQYSSPSSCEMWSGYGN